MYQISPQVRKGCITIVHGAAYGDTVKYILVLVDINVLVLVNITLENSTSYGRKLFENFSQITARCVLTPMFCHLRYSSDIKRSHSSSRNSDPMVGASISTEFTSLISISVTDNHETNMYTIQTQ